MPTPDPPTADAVGITIPPTEPEIADVLSAMSPVPQMAMIVRRLVFQRDSQLAEVAALRDERETDWSTIRNFLSQESRREGKINRPIGAIIAYAEKLEKLLAVQKLRDEIVPDLRDFKWLDPECHQGCQSLAWKGEIDTLRAQLAAAERDAKPLRCIFCDFAGTLAELKEHSAECAGHPMKPLHDFGKMMMDAFDGMKEAMDTTPGRENDALNSYIEVYIQQRDRLAQAERENAELRAKLAAYEATETVGDAL